MFENTNYLEKSDSKNEIYNIEKQLEKNELTTTKQIPIRFKFLKYNISDTIKNIILYNIEQLNDMNTS